MRRVLLFTTSAAILLAGCYQLGYGTFFAEGTYLDRFTGGILLALWTLDTRLSALESVHHLLLRATRVLLARELSKKHPTCIFYTNAEKDESTNAQNRKH